MYPAKNRVRISKKEGVERLVKNLHLSEEEAEKLHKEFSQASKQKEEYLLNDPKYIQHKIWLGLPQELVGTLIKGRDYSSVPQGMYCIGSD